MERSLQYSGSDPVLLLEHIARIMCTCQESIARMATIGARLLTYTDDLENEGGEVRPLFETWEVLGGATVGGHVDWVDWGCG